MTSHTRDTRWTSDADVTLSLPVLRLSRPSAVESSHSLTHSLSRRYTDSRARSEEASEVVKEPKEGREMCEQIVGRTREGMRTGNALASSLLSISPSAVAEERRLFFRQTHSSLRSLLLYLKDDAKDNMRNKEPEDEESHQS